MSSDNRYDAIVIGSGIGGLTVASLLSQMANKRVLILERHFKLGGFTHTFQRKGYEWDVGLHYVGGMSPGLLTRQFMDLVTGGAVAWRRIDDPYDQFIYPGLKFNVPGNCEQYELNLQDAFPSERQAIRLYFRDLRAAASWSGRGFAAKTMPAWIAKLLLWPGKSLACSTTKHVLRSRFSDERLRALLASQWGDYGLPPDLSAFAIHALIANDYLQGAFYPEGGSATLADATKEIIESRGGKCMVNHAVTHLKTERGQVTQVWTEHKGQAAAYTAPIVVSAIGADATYKHLLASEAPPTERELLTSNEVQPPTAVTLFVGLNDDPRKHGFTAGNYWIYDDFDHDAIYKDRNQLTQGIVKQCFLSFPSLRSGTPQKHTAELITFSDFESWQQWSEQKWLNRDAGYQDIKLRLATAMIDFVDRYRPGFKSLVAYSELATPLTVTSMMGHSRGAIYGFPATPQRYRSNAFPIRTSIKNLYLTGCDVGSLGINGAMMGGVMTSAMLLGPFGFLRLLRAARSRSR